MSESLRMWVETLFNITYLLVIWGLVITMSRQIAQVNPDKQRSARLTMWAFGLLALGDTGHVGFRVVAYALGGLQANALLVGLGALATAITVTFFYMLIVVLWRERFDARYGWFEYLLLGAGIVRLVIMLFPQNQWGVIVPPQNWGLIRNLPLMLQGVGVAYLILRDSIRKQDTTFRWVGAMIVLSYTFYAPVIFWVRQIPMLGMLMIPKTLAYLGMAFFLYNNLYNRKPQTATT